MRVKLVPVSAFAVSLLLFLATLVSPSIAAKGEGAGGAVLEPDASGFLDVEDGRLFYESFGDGFPVLFIHDGLAHSVVWDAQVSDLSADYRVIRYDRRGYGRSDSPTKAYSNLEDLHALIEHLRLDRAVLVGSSSGGGLVIDYTLAHPERVEAMVLVGAVVNGFGVSSHFMRRGYVNYATDAEVNLENWVNDPYAIAPGNDEARARLEAILRSAPQDLGYEKHQFVQEPDTAALGRLSEISVPTLIITAEHDIPDVHAHAGAIEAGIRGARRVVLDDAGHLCYLEQPEAFNRTLRVFLERMTVPKGKEDVARRARKPWSTFERGIVSVAGGEIYYEAMGAGEPLVLIHGGSLDHRMWDDQFERFAADFRVIRYDARGHGLSRSPFGPRRDEEDLCMLLDHLGIERAHVMGLSLGGRIAVDFALQHPDRVLKLIPVAPGLSGYEFDSPEEKRFSEDIRAAYLKGDFDGAADVFFRAWTVGPRRQPEDLKPQVRERVLNWARQGADPGMDTGYALTLDPPAIGRLAEIKAPTLVIIGDQDMPGILEIGDLIERNVAGSKKVVFKGAAHMVNVEQPEKFAKIVLEFLRK